MSGVTLLDKPITVIVLFAEGCDVAEAGVSHVFGIVEAGNFITVVSHRHDLCLAFFFPCETVRGRGLCSDGIYSLVKFEFRCFVVEDPVALVVNTATAENLVVVDVSLRRFVDDGLTALWPIGYVSAFALPFVVGIEGSIFAGEDTVSVGFDGFSEVRERLHRLVDCRCFRFDSNVLAVGYLVQSGKLVFELLLTFFHVVNCSRPVHRVDWELCKPIWKTCTFLCGEAGSGSELCERFVTLLEDVSVLVTTTRGT